MKEEILKRFHKLYGEGSVNTPRTFFAPGRVNLIGEHIDYNGGLVMPCALNMGTYGVMRKRDDNLVKLASGNLETVSTFSLDSLEYNKADGWCNYPKGVIVEFIKMGHMPGGFEMYVLGNLPSGAGLSSSASLTTFVSLGINELFGFGVDPVKRSVICQNAEKYNGVNCGIMDPFACTLGKADHAILLNCDTLEYEHIPLKLGDYRIVIANTNYRRGLADSKYNERRGECEEALADLRKVVDIKELCDLSPEEFEQHKGAIQGDIPRKRAEHAVYENYRTKAAAQAMSQNKLTDLRRLMRDSHISLRDLYEVSGRALDVLTAAAFSYGKDDKDVLRVLGTRMTGAGFGGCTVNIVHNEFTDDFAAQVGRLYHASTGTEASFYVAQVADGALEI